MSAAKQQQGSTTELIPCRIAPRVRQLIISFWSIQDRLAIVAGSCEYVELVESVLCQFEPEPEPEPLELLFANLQDRDHYNGVVRHR